MLFLATPHAGATQASLANAFRTVFGTTVSLEDLRAHDAHLRDLFDWYRNHAEDLRIETATYYELRGVGGVLPIVNPTSAHPGVGADPVGLDEDHLSIAKPRNPDAQVCGAARDLLRRHVLASHPALRAARLFGAAASAAPLPPVVVRIGDGDSNRIPHELPPPAETFFGRPAELKKLTERLHAGKNSVVVGPAGIGKTALAAEAIRAVVGETAASLAASPFPDGVVFLDLYTFRGEAEPTWNALANKLAGAEFLERVPARDRATEACRARRILIVIEGGEEADGKESRAEIQDVLSVLSLENRRLLLTRLSTQALPAESIELNEALLPADAASLLDSLSKGRVTGALRDRVLELLEGHPLALTWAGSLLARDDEDAERLVGDWQENPLPKLSDPIQADHTLEWLFEHSVRGLTDMARQALAAAGLLARTPFPFAAITATLEVPDSRWDQEVREALRYLVQRSLLRRSGEADHWQFTHVLGYRFARQAASSDPALRERLARWLRPHLSEGLAAGIGDAEPILLTRTLEHTAALLRMDDDQRLWIPLTAYLIYEASDRLMDLGRLALVDLALGAVAGWLERLSEDKAQEPYWLRERTWLLNRRGEVLRHQGNLAGALVAHQEALAVKQRLAATDPSNADWQRDLSVGHNKVGDVLRDQRDLPKALGAYREALTLIRPLVVAEPSNPLWQRDLFVSHSKVGDVLRDQDDQDSLTRALEAYREALVTIQPLAVADQSNTELQRDLSAIHNKVGDVLCDQGDLDGALAAYGEAQEILERLSATDRSNAGWRRDLSENLNKLGDVRSAKGLSAEALIAYREALAVIQPLAANDPLNARWQRDLSFSLKRMAEFHQQQNDRTAEALQFAEESLKIDERLAALDPTNVTWQEYVTVSRALVERLKG